MTYEGYYELSNKYTKFVLVIVLRTIDEHNRVCQIIDALRLNLSWRARRVHFTVQYIMKRKVWNRGLTQQGQLQVFWSLGYGVDRIVPTTRISHWVPFGRPSPMIWCAERTVLSSAVLYSACTVQVNQNKCFAAHASWQNWQFFCCEYSIRPCYIK